MTTAWRASSDAKGPPGLRRIDLAMTPFCRCPNNWMTKLKRNQIDVVTQDNIESFVCH